MTREQQNENWIRATPAFRAEVREEYRTIPETPTAYNMIAADILRRFFGHENLTSDAEVEEMLAIEKGKVQFLFDGIDDTPVRCEFDRGYKVGKEFILHSLFGAKCLPDAPSSDDNTEPKYKPGDKAIISNGFNHPLVKDGAIVTILSYHAEGNHYSCAIAPNVGVDIDAKNLEPYTEPQLEEYRKMSQTSSNCDISDCNSNTHKELYDALFALESASKSVRQALVKRSNDNQQ